TARDPVTARSLLEEWQGEPAAREQLALLDAMRNSISQGTEELSADPPIRMVCKLFTADECDYVRSKAEPEMRPSMIIDEATGQPRPHPVRTSYSMNFAAPDEDLVIHALNRRIATVTETDYRAGEPLHIL